VVGSQRRGDVAEIERLLAVDAVHQGIRSEWVCRNRDQIVDQVRRGVEGRRDGGMPIVDAVELVAAGDQVVLTVRGPKVGAPLDESEQFRGQICIAFTLGGGVITRMHAYEHRADAFAASGAIEWV